jgi:hypothetical protein
MIVDCNKQIINLNEYARFQSVINKAAHFSLFKKIFGNILFEAIRSGYSAGHGINT